jgi:hypothetical protein
VAAENLATSQDSSQVGVKNLVPVVFWEIECRRALGDAGGIDQDVDLPESL